MTASVSGSERIDGEFRHAVVLVADIVGSTAIIESLGAERGFLLVRRVTQKLSQMAERHSGRTLNIVGDGVICLFGAPVASETSALDSARAACAMLDELKKDQSVYLQEFGTAVSIRIGIASGEVIVIHSDDSGRPDATGRALNFANRIEAKAEPNSIVMDTEVSADLGNLAKTKSLGRYEIKGYPGEYPLFRLEGLVDAPTSFQVRRSHSSGRMVAREAELQTLLDWVNDRGDGPPVCVIEGPPGIGKSRLIDELGKALDPNTKLVFGNCLLNASTRSLMPLIEAIRHQFGWQPGQKPEVLAAGLSDLFEDGQAISGLFWAELAGQNVQSGQAYDHQAAISLRQDATASVSEIASKQDRLMVVEDTHWIDVLSADILRDLAVDRPKNARILLTARKGQLASWMVEPLVKVVSLRELERDALLEMAGNILGSPIQDPEVINLLVKRSDGNPFIAEEIIRHIEEEGATRVEAIGSIQNIVFSRFDRLSDTMKDVLRLAASEGRVFDSELIVDASDKPRQSVARLMKDSGGLLEAAPGRPETHLQFSHVLVRDVIYGSIPRTERPDFHLRIGNALEALSGDSESSAEALADHLDAGGAASRAISYHAIAGQTALRQYALQACDERMTRCFELVDVTPNACSPETMAHLLEIWVRCLDIIGNFRRLDQIVSTYLDQIPAGQSRTLCLTLASKSQGHMARFDEAMGTGSQAITDAENSNDELGLAYARVVRMRNISDSGRDAPGEMDRLFEATEAVAKSERDFYLTAFRLYTMLAWHRRMGAFRKARELSFELYDLSEARGDARGMAHGAWSKALISRHEQDSEGILREAKISRQHAVSGTSDYLVAQVLWYAAEIESGLAHEPQVLEPIILECHRAGNYPLRNATSFQQAIAYFRVGRLREGWSKFLEMKELLDGTAIKEQEIFVPVAECEIRLALAGLLPSPGPRPKLSFLDVLFALRMRIAAKGSILRVIDELETKCEDWGTGGYLLARVNLYKAALKARVDPSKARDFFALSRDYFSAEGCEAEIERVNWVEAQVLSKS